MNAITVHFGLPARPSLQSASIVLCQLTQSASAGFAGRSGFARSSRGMLVRGILSRSGHAVSCTNGNLSRVIGITLANPAVHVRKRTTLSGTARAGLTVELDNRLHLSTAAPT